MTKLNEQQTSEEHPKRKIIMETLRKMHAAGVQHAGPTEIARQAGEESGLNTSLASTHLKKLMDVGLVERVLIGTKRAHYRIIEQ